MIKALTKVGVEGTYLNIIKAIYNIPTANMTVSDEKIKTLLKSSKTRMPTLTTSIQHSIEVLARAIRQGKELLIRGIRIGKDEVKLSLFAGDITPSKGNPRDSTKDHQKEQTIQHS